MTAELTDAARALRLLGEGRTTSASIARAAGWTLERAQTVMRTLRDQGRVEQYMEKGEGCTLMHWRVLATPRALYTLSEAELRRGLRPKP